MRRIILMLGALTCLLQSSVVIAAAIAYIHGRVADDGAILAEGQGDPYDQMLITDSGDTGLSMFKTLVESQGHTIVQFRDMLVNLDAAFLNNYDVVIFGLHQKIWSSTEKSALDAWLNEGGGMFIYSDSASGGWFRLVGAQNPVGQNVTNNLIAQYGMQVTVDQADGVPRENASSSASITSIRGLTLEGEGVSPVAVAPGNSSVEILIPYTRNVNKRQGLTISNPNFASLALRPVGQGDIIVMFDRQPMWNNGIGSNIQERDNNAILREVMNFLAERPVVTPPTPPTNPGDADSLPPIINLLLDEPES